MEEQPAREFAQEELGAETGESALSPTKEAVSDVAMPNTAQKIGFFKKLQNYVIPKKRDFLALFILLVAALLYLSPSLKDGYSFGPTDLGQTLSVLSTPGPGKTLVHDVVNGDIITQGAAWNALDWKLVHSGQIPLWNSESGTGLPQFLNFESAPFALPTLIGYLFPLSVSFLITVLMKLFIAGSGVYLLLRYLRAGILPSLFGALSFMLSGPLTGWLGWSVSGPLVYAGWIVLGGLLCYNAKATKQTLSIGLFALACAFCIYGGFPEDYVLMAIAIIPLFLFGGIAFYVRYHRADLRGLFRIGLGLVGGFFLSSPLLIPGVSVLKSSVRNVTGADIGLPLRAVALFFAQGYYGLPTTTSTLIHSSYFGPLDYFETASYVGIAAIVFAIMAVLTLYKRPIVTGLFFSGIVVFLVIFELGASAPVQHLISDLGLGGVALQRALALLDFVIAVLAGLGLDAFLKKPFHGKMQYKLLFSLGVPALVLVVLWSKAGVGAATVTGTPFTITSVQASAVRQGGLLWPTFTLALIILFDMWLFMAHKSKAESARHMAIVGSLLVVIQGGFLIFAGTGINSYAKTPYPVTPAIAKLESIVKNSLFGLDGNNANCGTNPVPPCGLRQWEGIGLYPDMNLGYSLTELAMHDPTIPKSYFDAFPVPNNDQNGGGTNLFAPSIDSKSLAMLYGVRYVIIQPPNPIPRGMKYVATLTNGGVSLKIAEVPEANRFEFVYDKSVRKEIPGKSAKKSRMVTEQTTAFYSGSHPNDTTYTLDVQAKKAGVLYIKITNVPGWHAVINGKSVALQKSAGDLMQILLPSGQDHVTLTYNPSSLDLGYYLALVALIALLLSYLGQDFYQRRSLGASKAT